MSAKDFTRKYTTLDTLERKKAENMIRLEEYKNYYVYGKYKDGKLLYKECFLKVDIDGVPVIKLVNAYKRHWLW